MTNRYAPAIVAAVLAVASTACTTPTDPVAAATQPDTTATMADEYATYLQLAEGIDDPIALTISADDARLRAMLGCNRTWPEGTIDHALTTAYAPSIAAWRAEGACGR